MQGWPQLPATLGVRNTRAVWISLGGAMLSCQRAMASVCTTWSSMPACRPDQHTWCAPGTRRKGLAVADGLAMRREKLADGPRTQALAHEGRAWGVSPREEAVRGASGAGCDQSAGCSTKTRSLAGTKFH
ncbi:uncharacterized protein CC84DRAFT_246023 [Paraphaeosphaeria sporulosa]|uniref:Uncharacterized protein n=1 Tax=Paraphaeosphaeria sporulosa TaxID=1460663 RepID=A0A177BZI7_9PLEO|nr:uncharacterized protein CC84DRAFT_246023 [Paraphaeosphaeria sporulosa]OAG00793.1 hypothetical protein CC84DRAFT_246023 [Paraphaeosphaeria sporulosa]